VHQGKVDAYGATFPLLTDSAGNKFGKSVENGEQLWLDKNLYSSFKFYQFMINVADTEVE
jgi:tyrosyl-tRNA synthetase